MPSSSEKGADRSAGLIATLRKAFAGSRYPGDDRIVYQNAGHLECEQVRAAFRGKRWDAVPGDTVGYHHDALPFFSEEGFAHYLPAYLVASLSARPDMVGDVLAALTPPPERDPGRARFLHRAACFSDVERAAICSYLQHVGSADAEELGAALADANHFWCSPGEP